MDNYNINLSVNHYGVPPVVHAVQGDTGRTLVCNITDMEIPAGATAKFFAEKPSGAGIYNNATISGNTVTVELTNQTLAEVGTTKAQIQVANGDDTVSTFRFDICVEKTYSGDFPESKDESTFLQGILDNMQQSVDTAVENAEDATSAANSAASSANKAAAAANNALSAINAAVQGTLINDTTPSNVTTFSGQHIEETFLQKDGDGSSVTATFQQAAERQNIANGDTLAEMCGKIAKYLSDLKSAAFASTSDILLSAYPVGSIYLSVNNTNPGTLFGGTWVRWGTGRVPVGVDTTQTEFNTVEKTGGEKTHTLSSNELAKHQHRLDGHAFSWGTNKGSVWIQGTTATPGQGTSGNPLYTTQGESDYTYDTGSTEAHNNLQPYITCYMWKRTA